MIIYTLDVIGYKYIYYSTPTNLEFLIVAYNVLVTVQNNAVLSD